MKYLTFLFLFLMHFNLDAQVAQGLITWISFDKPGCEISDEFGDPTVQVFPKGTSCACGVKGNGLRFNGNDEWFLLFGNKVEDVFTTIDFSLSFYFKPVSGNTNATSQTLFSKRLDCSADNAFFIRYTPSSRILHVELAENGAINGSITKTLPQSCWYHIVVVRKAETTILYVNTKEVGKTNSPGGQRVNLTNDEVLTVGSNNCNDTEDFNGFMDEIRLYNRALTRENIEDLYLSPDQIANGNKTTTTNDTTIYLGNSVQINLTKSCASNYSWSPATGVSDVNSPTPVITPTVTTTYGLTMSDQFPCIANDSIRITVIDPTTVDCKDILLPSAFTPNGDGLNDKYGISNPFVAGEILAFQIFDRWGNIVFETTDPLEKWDGSYKGQPVNPGVFLYRIRFRCKGEEGGISGSVTVLR
jgi:gliding motility-associated-like protein